MSKFVAKLILFFILIFVFYAINCGFGNAMRIDDIWNFHMIQKINSGLIPYTEVPMIVTPLFHYIGVLFFKLFGETFFSFFVYGAITDSLIFMISIEIVMKLTKNKSIIALSTVAIFFFINELSCTSYNMLSLLFVLCIVLLEIKDIDKHNDNYDYLIGMMFGLCFLCKHTNAFFFVIAFALFLIRNGIKNKNSYKDILFKFGRIICGGLPVIILFVIYLLFNNNFIDFCDMCIGGVAEFGEKNFQFLGIFISFLAFLYISVFYYLYRRKHNEVVSSFLWYFIIASTFLAFPIFNIYHLLLSFYLYIFGAVYFLDRLLYENDFFGKFVIRALQLFAAVYVVFYCTNEPSLFVDSIIKRGFKQNVSNTAFDVYSYMLNFDIAKLNQINKVHEYMIEKEEQGYNVYILSSNASLYEIPYHIVNRNKFDMILNGNMGYNGTERMIEQIKNIENPIFLKSDYSSFYQESKEVDDFIKEHYTIVDSFGEFIIYTKI